MAGVTLGNVTKTWPDGSHAVRELDLEVRDGELMVLVGPSGCGKSTVLRMIAGLERVTDGTIHVGSRRVDGLQPQEIDVAMVFQNYALYPHMTVAGNLSFPLRMMRVRRSEVRERVARIAGLLDLGGLLDRRPGQLSGGQRQRVAMGRALVREPAVFLLDEPLSNLDAGLRVQMRGEIAALQRRLGTTTIFVTHDQVEAMTLGRRLAVLRDGRLQQVGPPRTVYDDPANTFVARFLGSPGMNLFPARLAVAGGGLPLGGRAIPIDDEGARGIARERAEQRVIVGLRPEAFAPPDTVAEDRRIPVDVSFVEALGHEVLVGFQTELPEGPAEGDALVARLPASASPDPGAATTLGVDTHRVHLFSPDGPTLRS